MMVYPLLLWNCDYFIVFYYCVLLNLLTVLIFGRVSYKSFQYTNTVKNKDAHRNFWLQKMFLLYFFSFSFYYI